jgi:hypothetical protein
MPHAHTVTILHAERRARAECACSWRWCTEGPPQPDVPARPDYVDRAVRAATWHVRAAAS